MKKILFFIAMIACTSFIYAKPKKMYVSAEKITECVKNTGCNFVGLSALMTTTVPAMEKTIEMLHREISGCKVMVGGAVLTQEYSKMINADFYAKDGMDGVKIAQSFYGEK